LRSLLVLLLLALGGGRALAYPQYIGKSYTNCVTCHYSPTGGGLPNSYGHATLEATFPVKALRDKLAKADVSGADDSGKPAWQGDVGLDTRFLFLPTPITQGGGDQWIAIPMLLEAGGVIAHGPVLLYATVTPRRAGAERSSYTVFSREHWVAYKQSDATLFRAGRMVLPFGVRLPDHTLYTREDFGFDKWGQSYGAELDYNSEAWSLALGGFAGDLWLEPTQLQQRGVAGSLAYNIPSRASIGMSLLASAGEETGQVGTAMFLRLRGYQRSYVLGELSGRYRLGRGASAHEAASFLRLGWFATEWLDLFFEWSGRGTANHYALTKIRYQLGASWHVLPWVEIAPAAVFEEDVDTGMQSMALVQLHVFY